MNMSYVSDSLDLAGCCIVHSIYHAINSSTKPSFEREVRARLQLCSDLQFRQLLLLETVGRRVEDRHRPKRKPR